jgi:Clp amino terminal domain, pathogenicity island component
MFERYTDRARRVIFFARYEASQYGSPYIETEHLLLGLLREDRALLNQQAGASEEAIRAEIEKQITRRTRISTSVEVPLSPDSAMALRFATEEAERLHQRHVGTEHLLAGLLRVEGSLAAKVLWAKGFAVGVIRERLVAAPRDAGAMRLAGPNREALLTLHSFLSGLKSLSSGDLVGFFAENAEFVDPSGKKWNRDEIQKEFQTLFAAYANKNVTYVMEAPLADTREVFVASVLWNNALMMSEQRAWVQRMSFVLLLKGEGWEIVLAQATPVQLA